MADIVTTTTKTGYGQNIIGALIGVPIGLILFAVSFAVLYWNEGRDDLSRLAKTAVFTPSATVDASQDQKLIVTTGALTTTETLGDTNLRPGSYLGLRRVTEMYSWKEDRRSDSSVSMGGEETTKTTYTYSKVWDEAPADSQLFKEPGHDNPQKSLPTESKKAGSASIGAYQVDINPLQLPPHRQLPLAQDPSLALVPPGGLIGQDNYLYLNGQHATTPEIGAIRIRYEAVQSGGLATLYGRASGGTIVQFSDNKGRSLFRAFEGGSREMAEKLMHEEYRTHLWIFRLVGFLMMWFGLMMLVKPVVMVLRFVPQVAIVSQAIVGFAAFVIAAVLSAVTIVVSMLLHNPIILLIVLIACVGGGGFFLRKMMAGKASAVAGPAEPSPFVGSAAQFSPAPVPAAPGPFAGTTPMSPEPTLQQPAPPTAPMAPPVPAPAPTPMMYQSPAPQPPVPSPPGAAPIQAPAPVLPSLASPVAPQASVAPPPPPSPPAYLPPSPSPAPNGQAIAPPAPTPNSQQIAPTAVPDPYRPL